MALSHHARRTEPITRYSWTGFICPGVPGWASPEEPGAAAGFKLKYFLLRIKSYCHQIYHSLTSLAVFHAGLSPY